MGAINTVIRVSDKFSNQLTRFCAKLDGAASKLDTLQDKLKIGNEAFKYLDVVAEKWNSAKSAMMDYANSLPVKLLEDEKRLKAIYGDKAGGQATQMYRNAAQSLGRGTQDYMSNAISMTKMGMSSNQTNDWLKMADRIATITGEEFSSVAGNLKSSIEGGSVSSLAQMLGGGAGTERQLERAGIGRMLSRGNLDGALSKFQKIADKMGYTAEAAEKMNNTVSNKVLKTFTKIENIVLDIKTNFANAIEPLIISIMNTVNKFLESKTVKKTIEFIKTGINIIKSIVEKVADVLDDASSKMIDFADWISPAIFGIGALLGGVKLLNVAIGLACKVALGAIKAVSVGLNLLLKHPILAFATMIVAGVTIASRYFQKFYEEITGQGLTFVESVFGSWFYAVGGIYQAFENLGIFFSNWFEGIKEYWINLFGSFDTRLQQFLSDLKTGFFRGVASVLDSILDKVISLLDAFGQFSDSATEAANKLKSMKDNMWNSDLLKNVAVPEFERYEGKYKTYGDVQKNAMEYAQLGIGVADRVTGFFKKYMDKQEDAFEGIKKDTGKIRGKLTEEQEVAWLKDLSERQYINRFNVQSPQNTLNLSVTNNKPMNANDIEKQLQHILDNERNAGGFGAGITVHAQGA